MVHLGFEVDLTFILDALPSETMEGEDTGDQMDVDGETMIKKGRTRVTTLFSATMPAAVERLARKYLRKPAIITIGEAGRAVDTVEQRVEFVTGDEKKKYVSVNFLPPILLITCSDKNYWRSSIADNTPRLSSSLSIKRRRRIWSLKIYRVLVYVPHTLRFLLSSFPSNCNSRPTQWNAATLHSGKNQEQREASLQSLRNGESDVLVATDLAGRGIDVQDVSLVINFQMANTIEAYVHRIGESLLSCVYISPACEY